MSRALPEWIGHSPNASIPKRVRARVFLRDNGECQSCHRPIRAGDKWECDHVKALVNGGAHRETNLQLLCGWCHGKKTKQDVAEKSTVYRKRAKDIGIKKKRTITRWRKFNGDPVYASRDR